MGYLYIMEIIKGLRAGNNWLRKSGTLLDLEKGLYMSYESIAGIRSGTWKVLPKIDYLLLFRAVYVKCEACSLDEFEDVKRGHYQLSLVHKQRRIILHESKNKEEVFAMARKLSRIMNLRVRDSASERQQPRWLETAV